MKRNARFTAEQNKHSAGQRGTSPGGHGNQYDGTLRSSLTFGHDSNINEDFNAPSMVSKISVLEKDLERRQESYVERERSYKTRIDELEQEVTIQRQTKTGWMKSNEKIQKLKHMQNQIINNVELVQDRTARILQEQERDLLRAFRARLFDVQTELEKEKSKKDDGAGAWIEKSRQLEAEVEWAREVADRLERVNQTLLSENNRLKSQFASQEEDRNFLITQLVSVKKDNARIKAESSAVEAENESLRVQTRKLEQSTSNNNYPSNTSAGTMPRLSGTGSSSNNNIGGGGGGTGALLGGGGRGMGGGGGGGGDAVDDKFKEVNTRLRRLLAEERKTLHQYRDKYLDELKSRTELETLLRRCVEDVRKEISLRHIEAAQFTATTGNDLAKLYSRSPEAIPLEEFTQIDRVRVLELLLSQERVLSILYAKTFPVGGGGIGGASKNTFGSFDASAAAGIEDSQLNGILAATGGGGGGGMDMGDGEQRRGYYNAISSVSEGGGGPLIMGALARETTPALEVSSGTKLPSI